MRSPPVRSIPRSCAAEPGGPNEDGAPTIDIAAFNATIPLRRIALPDDIVGPVMFLLGPDSGYMTGQTLWVNGGAYMP